MGYFGQFGDTTTLGTIPGAPPPLAPGMETSISGNLPGFFASEEIRSRPLYMNWQYDPAVVMAMQTNPAVVQSSSIADTDSFRILACQVIVALGLIVPAEPQKADASIQALASAWAYYEAQSMPDYKSIRSDAAAAHSVIMVGMLVDDCNAMRDWAAHGPAKTRPKFSAMASQPKLGITPGYTPQRPAVPPGTPAPGTTPPAAAASSSALLYVAGAGAIGVVGYLMYSRGMF